MRLKKKVFIIQICIIAFFIVGCSKSPQDYYPMKENTTMKYKIVMETRKRDNINSNSIDIKKTDMELERVFLSPEKLTFSIEPKLLIHPIMKLTRTEKKQFTPEDSFLFTPKPEGFLQNGSEAKSVAL